MRCTKTYQTIKQQKISSYSNNSLLTSKVKWKNKQTTTIYKRKQSQHKLENRLTTRQIQSVCKRLYIYNLTIVDDWTNAMQKLGFCTLHKHNRCIQIFICMGLFSIQSRKEHAFIGCKTFCTVQCDRQWKNSSKFIEFIWNVRNAPMPHVAPC